MDLRLSLLAIMFVGAAVGLMLPAQPDDVATDIGTSAPQPLPSLAASRGATSLSSDGAVLARAADGHFYADVRVDGQDVRMLVDTGASVVALTGADAEAMGFVWNEDDVRIVARGASGPVAGVPVVIGQIALGNHEAADVPGVIIPRGLDISLLGQSFLGTFREVRMADGQMILAS
ncbi:retropepsin-like aspartic protease family protein [Altererythrobacter lauratis]|uniref:TIGR02281 family clan AA aspartic protease n=1 Tax=Alteraurantiacibacter lauratis TaxID=2054627 RepID=A0ABV7EFV0_9SPHN